jgi:hypothetical protein
MRQFTRRAEFSTVSRAELRAGELLSEMARTGERADHPAHHPAPDPQALCHRRGAQGRRPGHYRLRDCVVAANEMPNVPHIELEKVGNYAVVKVKERA